MSSEHSADERDVVYRALGDDRRLTVLDCLSTTGGPLALADLARAVVAREGVESPVEPSGEGVQAVYLSLYHRHVPRLAEAGLVRFDSERELVGPGPRFDDLDSLLSGADDTAADDD